MLINPWGDPQSCILGSCLYKCPSHSRRDIREGGSGAFRVWTWIILLWFLQVSTNSSSSKASVLDLNSNCARKGSGFFEDDLIPTLRSSSMFSCAVASLLFRAAGHFSVLKLVNEPLISSRTSSEWYILHHTDEWINMRNISINISLIHEQMQRLWN